MTIHEEWLEKVRTFKNELLNMGLQVLLPPPSQEELAIEYIEVNPGKSIKGKVPFQEKFKNPMGTYQGGFLAAAVDDHFGPLSYLSAERPCTTLSLNITFLKPFVEKTGHCYIEAEVIQKTKSFIFMRAVITNSQGENLAHAESHVAILSDEQLQRLKK